MIGQIKLKAQIKNLIEQNTFPQTYLITGIQGQGRGTLAKYIANSLHYTNYEVDNKVNSIRDLILDANTVTTKTHYVIRDIDCATINAQNALLKLIEEPPANAIFCMTCNSEYDVLPTIKSRSVVFKMQPYSNDELQEFCKLNNIQIDTTICDTMQDIIMLNKYNYNKFNEFVDKLYTYISKTPYRDMKVIESNFNFKNDSNKYDLSLFFKLFIKKSLEESNLQYTLITNKYLNEIKPGTNLLMLFTNWFIDIKEAS